MALKQWSGVECIQVIPNSTPGGPDIEVPTLKCLEAVFKNIVTLVVSTVSLVLFIMLIIGGFKYLTSGGDPKATESAKNTMTYAILGLIAIVASYLILRLIATLTGVTGILKFEIPTF